MDIQKPPDFAVEVHLASLDTGTKKCALADLDNFSRQAETIRVDEPSNADTVTDLQLHHGSHSLSDNMLGKPPLWSEPTRRVKESFTSFNDTNLNCVSGARSKQPMKRAALSRTNAAVFGPETDSGLLIAFEGMDGSGKTTQRKLFKSWLEGMNEDVVVTKWNSSPLFK